MTFLFIDTYRQAVLLELTLQKDSTLVVMQEELIWGTKLLFERILPVLLLSPNIHTISCDKPPNRKLDLSLCVPLSTQDLVGQLEQALNLDREANPLAWSFLQCKITSPDKH